MRISQKLTEWLRRYFPAECCASLTAVLAAMTAGSLGLGAVAVAYCGTWGENLGFYGCILYTERRRLRREQEESPALRRSRTAAAFCIVKNLLLEFGVAELLDSFLLRPFFMYLGPKLVGSIPLGIFLGKLAADCSFYLPVIISYELTKKGSKRS